MTNVNVSVASVVKAFLAFILTITGILLSGFVGRDLWNWFAVSILNAPVITFLQVYALFLLFRFFKGVGPIETKPLEADWDTKWFGKAFAKNLALLILWGIAYLIKINL